MKKQSTSRRSVTALPHKRDVKKNPRISLKQKQSVAPRQSPPNRRTQIADAAIQVLAREGARCVTHRKIDRTLGLAEGSTSYYYRTRAELLAAAANRAVQLDLLDVEWQVKVANEAVGTVDANHFADRLADTLIDWLSPGKRERSLAKCELFLEASRDDRLRAIMGKIKEQFSIYTRDVFRVLGARNPAMAADSLLLFTLGAVYSRAISRNYKLDRAELKGLTRSAVEQAKER